LAIRKRTETGNSFLGLWGLRATIWNSLVLVALEFELLLGTRFTTWARLPALFCFSYFSGRVLCFCLWLALNLDPPTYASQVAGMTVVCQHTWPVGWGRGCSLTNFFVPPGLELKSSQFPYPK
jgi:hypothetical protein